MAANNKTNFEQSFENTFDLEEVEAEQMPAKVPETKKEVSQYNPRRSDIEDDYEFARENIYKLASQGQEALESLLAVAKEDESPRTYEVLATLIKTLSDTNKDLFEIQDKNNKVTKEVEKDSNNNPNNNYTQNNVYVGSTAELQKALKNGDQ